MLGFVVLFMNVLILEKLSVMLQASRICVLCRIVLSVMLLFLENESLKCDPVTMLEFIVEFMKTDMLVEELSRSALKADELTTVLDLVMFELLNILLFITVLWFTNESFAKLSSKDESMSVELK